MSNVKKTKKGLIEKSTGRKIVSPLHLPNAYEHRQPLFGGGGDNPTRKDWERLIKEFNFIYLPALIDWEYFCDTLVKLLPREKVGMNYSKPNSKTLQNRPDVSGKS